MPVETMASNSAWPSLSESHGNVRAESTNNTNNEWEMIAEHEEDNINNPNNPHVVILPINRKVSSSKDINGRPRSATVGGEGAVTAAANRSDKNLKVCGSFDNLSKGSDLKVGRSRSLRRCASTPDLLMSDNDHEVIVEDESDEDGDELEFISSDESDSYGEESVEDETVEEDVVRVKSYEGDDNEDSFEVVSEKDRDGQTLGSEPLIIDEDVSMDNTSAWTFPSASNAPSQVVTGAWGSKSAPSFKEILAKNADKPMSWGSDKQKTEAMLRDSHRRHHLRVRTKPKIIVAQDVKGPGMKHALSTGDLTKMMEMAEQEHKRAGRARMRKQFSDLMEEDEGDFIIGRGSGDGGGLGGGDSDMITSEVLGDTDAMDYYHRKDKGSQSTHNKKKERPDEAKRKEISMYKKEVQREKQQLGNKGGGGGKKKKKEKPGFGGKKERRRL